MASGKTGTNLLAADFLQLVQDELQRVEEQIELQSIASVEAVTAIGHYLQAGGGKRLRPILLLLASKLAGDSNDGAVRLGAVVELIHTATLVHDDVIDDAETRRGRPSANVLWGNQATVLAGDWLYMQAFNIALRQRDFRILELLIGLTQTMVEGELLQLERLGRIDITEADYMELVDRKTARLFSTCATLGALAGRGDDLTAARLGDYAWNLGMAFQLVDDILDFTAEKSVLGKPVGNDLREGKLTLPLVYALQGASPQERALVAMVLEDRSYKRASFPAILELTLRRRGVERARERALAFTDRAREIIGEFPESPAQRALATIPDLIIGRDY